MEFKNFENVPCIWKPPGDKGVYYSKFVELLQEKYKIKIESYWDLHKWSIENIDTFWGEIWYFTGIIYSKAFNQVIDLSIPMSQVPKWFKGAELNFAENILRHRDDHVAIVAIGEDREKRIITYAEMYEEVKRYTSAFRKIGLKKGDIIVGYTSNREEIIFAMLGANTIGAVFTGVLPLLGAQAILDRLKLVRPTILISVDRLRYNQEEINMLPKLQEITEGLPTLMKTIIVPSKPDSEQKDIGSIAKSCFLKEFLDLADDPLPDIVFEQVAFSHPIIISYTSGTTGPPKALIHDFGSILSSVRDQCLLSDFNRRGRSLSVSPWILAHVGIEGNECADVLAKEACDEVQPQMVTRADANAVARRRICGQRFGKATIPDLNCPRNLFSTIVRLHTGYFKGMEISQNIKSYPICKYCPHSQLTPDHVLDC